LRHPVPPSPLSHPPFPAADGLSRLVWSPLFDVPFSLFVLEIKRSFPLLRCLAFFPVTPPAPRSDSRFSRLPYPVRRSFSYFPKKIRSVPVRLFWKSWCFPLLHTLPFSYVVTPPLFIFFFTFKPCGFTIPSHSPPLPCGSPPPFLFVFARSFFW